MHIFSKDIKVIILFAQKFYVQKILLTEKSLISAKKTCAMFQGRMLFDQMMHSHRMTCM